MGSTMTKSIQLSKNRNIDYLYIYFERNATLIICYFRFAAKSKKIPFNLKYSQEQNSIFALAMHACTCAFIRVGEKDKRYYSKK